MQRSKKALKQSLAELIKKKSVLSITVSDIVENAGYSRGAFYSHYNSKEDFLMSIIDEEILKYIDIVHDSIKDVHAKDSANWVYNVTLNLFEHYTIIRKSRYNVNNIRLSLIKTCCFYNNNIG